MGTRGGRFSFSSWLGSPGAGRYERCFMGHLLFEPEHGTLAGINKCMTQTYGYDL